MGEKQQTKNRTDGQARLVNIAGWSGIRVIVLGSTKKLELRHTLGVTRELFGRLLDVSVRTVAEVESTSKKVEKLKRNYLQLKRLCDSLSEVVDEDSLGEWFNTPNSAFGDLKPLELIERGEIDRLWEMYFRLRSGIPG